MNTYFVKYDGCDEQGRVRISLSWLGSDGDCHEHIGNWLFGVRGFTRSAKPTFMWLEDEPDAEVWYMPDLGQLLTAVRTVESWNVPTEVDKFLWHVVTSLNAVQLASELEPGFMDRP